MLLLPEIKLMSNAVTAGLQSVKDLTLVKFLSLQSIFIIDSATVTGPVLFSLCGKIPFIY
jgi:hypothetical protein